MNFNLLEAIKSMSRNKILSLGLVIQLSICLILSMIAYDDLISSTKKARALEKYNNMFYYSISDQGDEDGTYKKYRNSEMEYINLKNFVNEIRNTDKIIYLSNVRHPIDIINQNIPLKFTFNYEIGDNNKPQFIEDESGEKDLYTWVKGCQISKESKELFDLRMDLGTFFDDEDYKLKDYSINIILGYEYRDLFQLGDEIDLELFFSKFKGKVIGFLSKDSNIIRKEGIVNLDRYVLIPSFIEMDKSINYDFRSILLAEQANGEIVTFDKSIDIPKIISKTSNKYATLQFNVRNVDGDLTEGMLGISMYALKYIRLLNTIIIVFTIISISLIMIAKLNSEHYRYGVQIFSGASMRDIINQIVFEILLLVLLSIIITMVSTVILKINASKIIIIIVSFIIFLLSLIAPIYRLSKTNINEMIRRNE